MISFVNFALFHIREVSNIRDQKEDSIECYDLTNGSKEIILLGQNVNAYNNKEKKLSDLI